jgi:hypothetical protein
MADDVFALSPISARPAQPSEADYEAIRDAFMETSRGRWFLGEYAKRNRNADTSMVLDAVARIEQALAAQQRLQQQQEMQAAQEAEASVLPEVLAAIRHAVASAEGAATAALDGLALEQNLAPVRKGLRIIKEISWRWREIGADSRICDLIDSQVVAIDAACNQLTGADPRAAMIASFDVIKAQLDGFEQAEVTATPAADESIAPAAEMAAQPQAAVSETSEAVAGAATDVAARAAATLPAEAGAATAEPVLDTPVPAAKSVTAAAPVEPAAATAAQPPRAQETVPEASVQPVKPVPQAAPAQAQTEIPAAPATAPAAAAPQGTGERAEVVDEVAASTAAEDDLDIVVVSKAEADAHDEAILDLVAAEMAAPDATADDKAFSPTSTIHYDIEEPVSVDDDIVATFAEPTAPAPKPEPAPTVTAVPPTPGPAPIVAVVPQPAAAPIAAPQPAPVPPSPVLVPAPVPAPAPRLAVAPMPQAPVVPPQPVMQMMQEPVRPAPAVAQPLPPEQPRPAAALHPLPKPIPQQSLGSTLLASGMLQRPIAANDPLTPIRRMTQPEKIAFFS